jgi:predicted component of type VI protein secretion system
MLSVRIENLATHESVEHTFHRSPVRVGRNALNELTLNEGYVSLSHAVLRFDAEKIQVIDLGSTNGTLVDRVRIESNVPFTVKESSDLRIGDLRFHLSRAPTAAAVTGSGRDLTQFRLATRDFRNVPVATPGARVPAPPTLMVPSLASLPRTGTTPPPSPVEPQPQARPGFTPPPAESPRVSVASFPGQSDPNATLLDMDLLQRAVQQDVAGTAAPADEDLVGRVLTTTYQLYVDYRKSWRKFHDVLQKQAGTLDAGRRAALAEALERQMPALYQEEQFRAFAGKPSGGEAPVRTAAESQGANDAERLLNVFSRTYAGGPLTLASSERVETFLGRLAELLETFATSFIELRRGQAEFGNQIAVRTVSSDTPLRKARSAKELLQLILAPGTDGGPEVDDLRAGFGEVMFHQVAFLSGTREGVKALLEELDPAQLEKPPASPGRPDKGGVPYMWPAVLWTRWRRFTEVWKALGDEEQGLRILFGPEFARAYAMVMGGQLSSGKSASRPNVVSRTEKKPAGARPVGRAGTDKLPPR